MLRGHVKSCSELPQCSFSIARGLKSLCFLHKPITTVDQLCPKIPRDTAAIYFFFSFFLVEAILFTKKCGMNAN